MRSSLSRLFGTEKTREAAVRGGPHDDAGWGAVPQSEGGAVSYRILRKQQRLLVRDQADLAKHPHSLLAPRERIV